MPALPVSPVVIDTNIALDLLVFNDASTQTLAQALAVGRLQWLAAPGMRAELVRVLGYARVQPHLHKNALRPEAVLARFDVLAHSVPAAPRAPVLCSDADDQPFIDLAVQHAALLLSKDQALLCLGKRLLMQGVRVQSAWLG